MTSGKRFPCRRPQRQRSEAVGTGCATLAPKNFGNEVKGQVVPQGVVQVQQGNELRALLALADGGYQGVNDPGDSVGKVTVVERCPDAVPAAPATLRQHLAIAGSVADLLHGQPLAQASKHLRSICDRGPFGQVPRTVRASVADDRLDAIFCGHSIYDSLQSVSSGSTGRQRIHLGFAGHRLIGCVRDCSTWTMNFSRSDLL